MGCGPGMTCWRRLRAWQAAWVWARLRRVLLDRLGQANAIDWGRCALDSAGVPAKGGRAGRADPDRPRQAGQQAPCSRRCQRCPAPPCRAGPTCTAAGCRRRRSLPCRRSASARADPAAARASLRPGKARDVARCRRACRKRGIVPRIARRGIESRERLGRRRPPAPRGPGPLGIGSAKGRGVVERAMAWFARRRRLAVRHERRAGLGEAFHHLATAPTRLGLAERWFGWVL